MRLFAIGTGSSCISGQNGTDTVKDSESKTPNSEKEDFIDEVAQQTSQTSVTVTSGSFNVSTCIKPKPPDDCESFIESAFKDVSKVHSKYTCISKNCSHLSSGETNRVKSSGNSKDRFQHQWLLDPNIAYCEKTGYFWLLYEEGTGMFCLICKKHNAINLQNKSRKFSTDASVRYKRSAVIEHGNSQQHKSAIQTELTRRTSSFQKQVDHRRQVNDDVYFNAFLSLYWLAKEELANRKFVSLISLTEKLGVVDMKYFQHRSGGAVREMFLLLGKMIKLDIVKKIKQANTFGLLTDEVCDIANVEQLITFIKYVDVNSNKASTKFVACDDLLSDSNSANATTIKNTLMKQVKECGLDVLNCSSIATDGCSVMTGRISGVSAQLRKESPLLLNVHCICHRLALACGDANDDVAYIITVEKILIQLWSFFKNSGKRTAAYGKAAMTLKAIHLPAKGRKKVAKSIKKACRTRWLSTEKAIDGIFEDFEALCQTLRVMKENGDATATGLLNMIGNIKFLSAVYLLHAVLPTLAHLSKAFQGGNVSFASIAPSINYTLDKLDDVASKNKPLEDLKKDLGEEGRLSQCDLPKLTDFHKQRLANLTKKYVTALKENINSRFEDSLPVLTAFKIFDPITVPERSDPDFKEYGVRDIGTMTDYFYAGKENKEEMEDELLCEWQKFKYNLLQFKNEIPLDVLNPPAKKCLIAKTALEWTLEKMLAMRVTYQYFVPELLRLAEICLSLPVSNAWPERGASAVKRLKTRMRSTMKNDMLSALLHITINGPDAMEPECDKLIKETVKEWMKIKQRRKIANKSESNVQKTVSSFSDASVQVDLSSTDCDLAMDLTDAVDLTEASQEINNEVEVTDEHELLESESSSEVNDALRLMNLPISGSNFYSSDSSSDDDE